MRISEKIARRSFGFLLLTVALLSGCGRPSSTGQPTSNSPGVPANNPPHVRSPSDAKSITNSIGMKLVLIPAGKFLMGAPNNEKGRNEDEEPQHEVEITRPFYMGIYTVTVGQFRAFVQDTGYQTETEKDGIGGAGFNEKTGKLEEFKAYTWKNVGWAQTDEHPVVNVTWNDAVAFCNWLSKKESRQYRLPTEAEWEYACRANTRTRFSSGDDEESLKAVANIADASLKRKCPDDTSSAMSWDDGYPFTAPVGKFQPNAFGLYDMHGNVRQWCSDWSTLDYYQNSPRQDPKGPDTGRYRAYRGGSFYRGWLGARSAARHGDTPLGRLFDLGFRVVCVP